MAIPALKLGQAIQIDWADCKSQMGWTYNPKIKRTPGYLKSMGFFVQCNEECLTLTTSMDDRGSSLDDLSIPLGAIKTVQILPAEWAYKKEAA